MSTIDFDVNLISKIHFRPSYHDKDYVWKTDLTQPKYKRVFFGIFKMKNGVEYLPVGFYKSYRGYYGDSLHWSQVHNDEFDRWNYVIKDVVTYTADSPDIFNDVIASKEAWRLAYVEVCLGYSSSISRHFDTDEEAKAWIEHLKLLSNKTFETVEFN
jgi:hypothetical protein